MESENGKPTLLIIDDDQSAQRALHILLMPDYHVIVKGSAEQGLAQLKQSEIEVVLTDINIPDMNGLDVLKRIKAHDPLIEVVMVTGYGHLDTAKVAMRLGACAYVNKPFEVSQVQEVVREALAKRNKAKAEKERLKALEKQNKEMETHLIRSERIVNAGQLTCGVIHEINNPLTIIQGYVEILLHKLNKSGHLTKEEIQEYQQYLSSMDQQVQQCRDIAVNFLNMVRESKIEYQPVEINPLLEELIKLFRAQQMANQVTLMFQPDPTLPTIFGHTSLMRQVFVNLMVNALHAMPQGGHLQLTTQAVGEGIEVQVQDTGSGIAPENVSKLFQGLFSTKENGKGTGLGLVITKTIIERHGGKISVQSQVGKGTTFLVYLPKHPQEHAIPGAA